MYERDFHDREDLCAMGSAGDPGVALRDGNAQSCRWCLSLMIAAGPGATRSGPGDCMIMGKMWLSGQPHPSHDHGIERLAADWAGTGAGRRASATLRETAAQLSALFGLTRGCRG
ncbi:hypothetical protein GCM10010199_27890 [Dactylosporangium roseum]